MSFIDNVFKWAQPNKTAEKLEADMRSRVETQKAQNKVGLGSWYASFQKPVDNYDYLDYPKAKYELPKNISGQISEALDNFHNKAPKVSSFLGSAVRNSANFLGQIENFLTDKETPVGWVGGYTKRLGEGAAKQVIGGYEQMKSGTPSKIPFTNIQVPSKIAGPIKIGFGALSLTPAMQIPNIAMEGTQDLAERKFGKDSLIPTGMSLIAGLATPGNEVKDAQKAASLLQKLESGGGKMSKIQKEFRALPIQKRMAYLAGKFSDSELVKMSASSAWAKIERIENETAVTSKIFNPIFARWVAGRDTAKTRGIYESFTVNVPKGITGQTFLDRLEGTIGKSTPEIERAVNMVRTKLDTLHKEAQAAGIPLGYLENYAPHLWRQTKEEVEAIFKSAGQKFKHAKERKIPTYAEGRELGLTPLFDDIRQVVGLYSQRLSEARANINFVRDLKLNKLIATGENRLPGWVAVTAEGFPRSIFKTGTKTAEGNFYASPEVAQVLNNVFGVKTQTGAEKVISGAAFVSGKLQDFTLSGGVPFSPLNAWTLSQYFFKEVIAGRLTGGPKALYHSMVNTDKYFETNLPIIRKMQAANIPMKTSLTIENIGKNLFRNMNEAKGTDKLKTLGGNIAENWKRFNLDNPGIGQKLETAFNQTFSDTTFFKFMPALQIEFWKDTYNAMLKSGKVEAEASRIASQATKNWYGLTSTDTLAKQSELGRNIFSTIFFAPRYRETMVNFLWNTTKSVIHPFSPEYAANRNFIIGKVVQYATYDQVNLQTTGNHIWDNPEGYKDKIMIKTDDGYIGIPFDSSILTVPRAIGTVGQKLFEGDLPGAIATGVSRFASTGVAPLGDLLRNKDYWDREIVKPTDTPEEKSKKTFMYLVGRWNHPYLREMIDPRSKDDPLYQRLSRAAELPIKYYSTTSVESANYFNNLKESMNSLSPEERAIVEKNTTVRAEKKLKLDEDGTPSNATNQFEKMSKAAERLVYPGIIKAETEAQLKTSQQTGELVSPYYYLSPQQQATVELLKTFLPGSSEKSDVIKANENWIQTYYSRLSVYYDYLKANGKFSETLEAGGAPIQSPEIKAMINEYFRLTSGKALYLQAHPELQQYFTDSRNWNNSLRAEMGVPLLPEYGSYGSGGGKKPRGAVKSFGEAPALKTTSMKIPKLKIQKVKAIKTPKLKITNLAKSK